MHRQVVAEVVAKPIRKGFHWLARHRRKAAAVGVAGKPAQALEAAVQRGQRGYQTPPRGWVVPDGTAQKGCLQLQRPRMDSTESAKSPKPSTADKGKPARVVLEGEQPCQRGSIARQAWRRHKALLELVEAEAGSALPWDQRGFLNEVAFVAAVAAVAVVVGSCKGYCQAQEDRAKLQMDWHFVDVALSSL